MTPIFAIAVQGWLQLIFNSIPKFWTFFALEHLQEIGINDYLFITIGFIYNFAVLGVLFHLFNKKF